MAGPLQPMLDAQGSLVQVPAEQVQAATGAGAMPLSPEEFQRLWQQQRYGDSPVTAAGLGLLRGATLGASDWAGVHLGMAAPEDLQGYQQANAGASTVGQLAGAIAPLALSGGESAAGQAMGATPMGLVGRLGAGVAEAAEGLAPGRLLGQVAAQGARGALEGAAMGAGDAISESILQDKQLTAEHLLAEAGRGAAIGGLGGVAIEGALGLAKQVLPKGLAEVSSRLDDLASKLEEAHAPAHASELEASAREVAKAQAAHVAEYIEQQEPRLIRSLIGGADAGSTAAERVLTAAGAVAEATPATRPIVSALTRDLGAAQDGAERWLALRKAERAAADALEASPSKSLEELHSHLRTSLDDSQAWGQAAEYHQRVADVLGRADAAASSVLDAAKGAMEPQQVAELVQAGRDLLSGLDREVYSKLGVGKGSVRDLQGLVDDLGARAGDAERAAGHAKEAAAAHSSAVDRLVQGGRGAMQAAQGMLHGVGEVGDVALGVLGMLPGMHSVAHIAHMIHAPTRMAEVVAKLASTSAKVAERIKVAADAAIAAPAKGAVKVSSTSAIKAGIEAVRARAQDPEKLAAHVQQAVQGIDPHAPQVAQAVAKGVQAREKYLAEQLPHDPVGVASPGRKWEPSPAELQRWASQERAVRDPMTLLEDARAGRLTPSAVQAVEATSPKVLQAMRAATLQRLADLSKPLSSTQQVQLSILMGAPVTFGVGHSKGHAAALAVQPQQPPQGGGQGGLDSLAGAAGTRYGG